MNQAKLDTFIAAYREALPKAVERNPDHYAFPAKDADKVVDKMAKAMAENPRNVNYNSPGFKAACRKLGIPTTMKAILTFIEV